MSRDFPTPAVPKTVTSLQACTRDDVPERLFEPLLLLCPADHRHIEPRGAPRPARLDSYKPVGLNGAALPLQLERLERLDRDRIARERQRHRPDQDLARLRRLLQTRRHIHRVPGREKLTRHRRNLTAVHPDPKLQPRPEVALELVVQTR